jgi:Golgi nucleoside diphosphatase
MVRMEIRDWLKQRYMPLSNQWNKENTIYSTNVKQRDMTIQGLNLKKGDKFQVGDDSSVYTFINVTTNEKYGFEELNAENEFDSISSFRIDNMVELGLTISKVY